MTEERLARFVRVVSAVLGLRPEEVRDELTPESVDTWDSLNHVNLISALEQEFDVRLPALNLIQARSIADLKTLLREHGADLS
jgi:acyl carrier protein